MNQIIRIWQQSAFGMKFWEENLNSLLLQGEKKKREPLERGRIEGKASPAARRGLSIAEFAAKPEMMVR